MLATGWKLYSAVILIVVLAAGGIWWLGHSPTEIPPVVIDEPEPEVVPPFVTKTTIGSSVAGREITAYQFGSGTTTLLFVGGIHGGYEWNSSLLAYEIIDYLTANPDVVADNLSISIIPDLNPDATSMVTGTSGRFTIADIADPSTRVAEARFNVNNVDLNRNFACKWAPESSWRGEVVSAGTNAFSEPEAAALRDYVANTNPAAVVFWHSQANNVYASECEDGILPSTLTLMSTYARAGNYGEVAAFTAYPITGDAEGWLASIGIPAITVELESFRSIEWERNLAGFKAVLNNYTEQY